MQKNRLGTFFYGLAPLLILCAHVGASGSSACDDELRHYTVHGFASGHFFDRLQEGKDEVTKATLMELAQLKARAPQWGKEKEKLRTTYLGLAAQEDSDLSSRILYLCEALKIVWTCNEALRLADLCHKHVQELQDPREKVSVAHYGLFRLNVELSEPGYDLHQKLVAVPHLISLLEDLKEATKSMQSSCDMALPPFGNFFHEDCIPQAQVCALLAVAYGGKILAGEDAEGSVSHSIYNNRLEAIDLYKQGLEGTTTPAQRKYYHAQIVNLVQGLGRMPALFAADRDEYRALQQKNALALARIYKDEGNKAQADVLRAYLAYKAALAYTYAEKKEQALKFVESVLATPRVASENGLFVDGLKVRAEHLKLELTAPEKILAFECDHLNVFWKE
ncbi:MAG: hypothetical protein C0514_01150 [Candidatus Puniceispirillum sp.]|nr:hypothetical protein [Candidatus Puniceispirillum sp.]